MGDLGKNPEVARFWRDPDLGGSEFMLAHFVSHHFAPHTHDEYVFGLIEDGVETYRYRGSERIAAAGELVVVEPGEPHTGAPGIDRGFLYRSFYVPVVQVAAAADALGMTGLPHFRQTVLQDVELARAMHAMHVAVERGQEQLERESRFTQLLMAMVERHSDGVLKLPRGHAPSGVQRAVELVESRYAEPLTLSELAREASMSDFHFAHSFTRAVGMSPHRYHVQKRVLAASQLLRAGMAPAEVARRVGFADQAHLTRHFKKSLGVTPGRFALGR